MEQYRANIFDADGHFVNYRTFACDTDSNATGSAKHLFSGSEKIELWCGARLVARLGVKSQPRRHAVSHTIIDGRMVPNK